MKFLVVLCLLALSAAEDDSQEVTPNDNNQSNSKTSGPEQSAQSFTNQFSPSAITFGNKDSVPFPSFGNAASAHKNPDLFSVNQVTPTLPSFSAGVTKGTFPVTNGAYQTFSQGVPTGSLPAFSQVVPAGSLPAFPQGVTSGNLPTFPQGVTSGSLPAFPQGLPTGNLPAFSQGVPNTPVPTFPAGTVPNFRQGVTNGALTNLTPVRTVLQGTSLPSSFHVPTTVVSGLTTPFNGYTGGVYSGLHGTQGVPVNTFNGNNGNVAYAPLVATPYRVLPQENLSGFPTQGLQHSAVSAPNNLPPFTSNLLTTVPNGVFNPNQAILKTPISGTTQPSLSLQSLSTGNVPSEPSENVFRHA